MKADSKKESILVIFGDALPQKESVWWEQFDLVSSRAILREKIEEHGKVWMNLDSHIETGSIYEANAFAEELSRLAFVDGTRIAKVCTYEGYELWWIHYTDLFFNFCIPYTQYKNLLAYIKDFKNVHMYETPFKSLFMCYLNAYGCVVSVSNGTKFKSPSLLPFGMALQIFLTLLFLPVVLLQKKKLMIFIGDRFSNTGDYDARVKLIYQELRGRKVPFIEYIRSMESWKTVLAHAVKRRRPVIYASAIKFIARYMSILTGGATRSLRRFNTQHYGDTLDTETRFKRMVATQYLLTVHEDELEIRIMKFITRISGVKAGFIAAGNARNFHTLIGCKLNNIPTVGILHGVASKHYNIYDFMPAYDGDKSLSVDTYGVWSEWWRQYYIENSSAYTKEQLQVSGNMRPFVQDASPRTQEKIQNNPIKVLLVSEIVAVPLEIVPYLESLLKEKNFSVYIKFRQHNDSFEAWLRAHRPDILLALGSERALKGSMQDAIGIADVVVGSQSTGVIEATLLAKPFVFFKTKKWGDYFDMKSFDSEHHFFAETPEELVLYVKESTEVPHHVLEIVRERFFGDPNLNGSTWVVDRLITLLDRR